MYNEILQADVCLEVFFDEVEMARCSNHLGDLDEVTMRRQLGEYSRLPQKPCRDEWMMVEQWCMLYSELVRDLA